MALPTLRGLLSAAAVLVVTATAVLVVTVAAPAAALDRGAPSESIFVVEVDGLIDPVTVDLVTRSLDEAERLEVALFVLAVDSNASVDVDGPALVERVRRAAVPYVAWVKAGGTAEGLAADLVAASDVEADAPALRDLIAELDGERADVDGETVTLRLGSESGEGEKDVLPVRFRKFTLAEQAQHALTSPFVAFLLLVLGLCLVLFEFFAIGVGLAALTGALLVLGSFVGLLHLPVDPAGMAMLVLGFVALAIDVQAGRPAFWTVVGTVLLLVGSMRLYDGPSVLDPPWWQVVLVVGGALLFLLPGLAAVIRSRFSTPTIGRESMVGEEGTAEAALDPEGVVTVRGAPWRARATRAAGIGPGDPVRVTAIQGLTLEVEPVETQSAHNAPAE